ncbi:11987_t:CDS:1, partial [Racocetra persica]
LRITAYHCVSLANGMAICVTRERQTPLLFRLNKIASDVQSSRDNVFTSVFSNRCINM